MIKEYIIIGEGYYNTQVANPLSLGLEIGDIQWQGGAIHFKGTEEQLESFLMTLIEDETYFKYRDWFEKEEFNNLERIPLL